MLKNSPALILLLSFLFASCQEVNFVHGKRSYEQYCATCHMDDGSGLAQMVPSLYYEKAEIGKFSEMPCLIRKGIYNPDSVFQMLANPDITSIDITNVLNYIANDFNKLDTVFTLQGTELLLDSCVD